MVAGSSATITATAIGGSGTPEYRFYRRLNGESSYTIVQDYSSNNVWIWNSSGATPGTYSLMVYVRNQGSPALYEAAGYLNYATK